MLTLALLGCVRPAAEDSASIQVDPGDPCIDDFADPTDPADDSLLVLPPVVVCTWPRSGDPEVDPDLDVITVRFSHPMSPEGWTWLEEDGIVFPQTVGNPTWLDSYTQQLPVSLTTASTYGLWINSEGAAAFRSEAGVSAVPYALWFATAAR